MRGCARTAGRRLACIVRRPKIMPIAIGSAISLEDEGEGWFPLAASSVLRGRVVAVVPNTEPFYVIHLDVPLEVQEPATDTPSHLRLFRYVHAIVNSRCSGVALGSAPSVSTHVRLVPPGSTPPSTAEGCSALPLRIWAACHVSPSYA